MGVSVVYPPPVFENVISNKHMYCYSAGQRADRRCYLDALLDYKWTHSEIEDDSFLIFFFSRSRYGFICVILGSNVACTHTNNP